MAFSKAALGVKLGIRGIISLSNVHVVALDAAAFGNADAAAPDSSRDDVPVGNRESVPLGNRESVPLGSRESVPVGSKAAVAFDKLRLIAASRRAFCEVFMVCVVVAPEVVADTVPAGLPIGPLSEP